MVIVCKRKGYSYELKEIIELLFHKMTDDPMNNKDIKKVGGAGRSSAGEHFGGLPLGCAFSVAFEKQQEGLGIKAGK